MVQVLGFSGTDRNILKKVIFVMLVNFRNEIIIYI